MLRRTKRLCKAAGVEDTLKALSCLYGIELLEDNLKTCHERLLEICRATEGWDGVADAPR